MPSSRGWVLGVLGALGCAEGEAPRGLELGFVLAVDPRAGIAAIAVERGHGLAVVPRDADGVPGSGPADTVELTTTGTAADCLGLDTFCFDVELRSFFGQDTLTNVFAELTALTPPIGHEAVSGLDELPGIAQAFGVSERFGVFDYPSLPPLGSATRRWGFRSYGTAFEARGRIVADVGPLAPPAANADAYAATGNTELVVGPEAGVLVNDRGDRLVALAASGATSRGGDYVLAANGGFRYRPALRVNGADTFTYRARDALGAEVSATVTITVSGMIWHVDNSAAPGGDGRSHRPFRTLKAAERAALAAHWIRVQRGDGTSTGLDEGIVLKDTQRLQGVGMPLLTAPQATAVVTVGRGNIVEGLRLAAVGASAVSCPHKSSLRLQDLSITGGGIDLFDCAGTFRVLRVTMRGGGVMADQRGEDANLYVEDSDIEHQYTTVQGLAADGALRVEVHRSRLVTGGAGLSCDSDFGNGSASCLLSDSTVSGWSGASFSHATRGATSGTVRRSVLEVSGYGVGGSFNTSVLQGNSGYVRIEDSTIDGAGAVAVSFWSDGTSYDHRIMLERVTIGATTPVERAIDLDAGDESWMTLRMIDSSAAGTGPGPLVWLRSTDEWSSISAELTGNRLRSDDPSQCVVGVGVGCLALDGNVLENGGTATISAFSVEELSTIASRNTGVFDVTGNEVAAGWCSF